MTKILRLTRHEAEQGQLDALAMAFDVEKIETVSESLPANSREAVARFDELAKDYNVVEAVLPINLLEAVLKFSQFSKRGGMVIRAQMNRELVDGQAVFKFDHYEVVKKVEIVTRPL